MRKIKKNEVMFDYESFPKVIFILPHQCEDRSRIRESMNQLHHARGSVLKLYDYLNNHFLKGAVWSLWTSTMCKKLYMTKEEFVDSFIALMELGHIVRNDIYWEDTLISGNTFHIYETSEN